MQTFARKVAPDKKLSTRYTVNGLRSCRVRDGIQLLVVLEFLLCEVDAIGTLLHCPYASGACRMARASQVKLQATRNVEPLQT